MPSIAGHLRILNPSSADLEKHSEAEKMREQENVERKKDKAKTQIEDRKIVGKS